MKKKTSNTPKINTAHRNAVLRHQANVGAMSLALMAERDFKKKDVSNSNAKTKLSSPKLYRHFAASYGHDNRTTAQLALRMRKKMFPLRK